MKKFKEQCETHREEIEKRATQYLEEYNEQRKLEEE